MNYIWHYHSLIETRRDRVKEYGVYYERHHIIMKSMGGGDEDTNLVFLTAREHFIAHWLLWRIYRNRASAYAFNAFTSLFTGKNFKQRPSKYSSKGYAEAREAYSYIHRERLINNLNSNRSKVVLQYDLDGVFIKEWPSAKEIQRTLGIGHVTDCCRGEREYSMGFIWKYKNPILKKSKPYKKRIKPTLKSNLYSNIAISNMSNAAISKRWYNDGMNTYFLTPFSYKIKIQEMILYPGRKINTNNV